ncbi:MAG: T9SS type A sorting domain-containing protein [Bacteroidota bacterium]
MPRRYTALVLAALVFSSAALAQKPEPRSALEIGTDAVSETVADADGLRAADGTPRALYRQNYAVDAADPETMARQYLAEQADALRIDADALALRHVRSSRAGHNVRFTQMLDGAPVHGSEVVVNIDPRNRVQLVLSDYQPSLAVPRATPSMSADAARSAAHEHLDVSGALLGDETSLVVYPTADGGRLAWRVRVTADAPMGDWESFVDASTGELLRVARRTVFHHGSDEEPTPATPVRSIVEATGQVYDTDPLTVAGAQYGDTGFVDGGDANTPQLEATRIPKTFEVTQNGSTYRLESEYADIDDWAGPFKGEFERDEPDWSVTRDDDAFEAVTVYWHIDNYMRYINETLEIEVRPYQYATGVRFDPHGFNGADNSSYSTGTARLQFGEGGVDDAEDADVIIHELGHGLHDWLTVGGLSNGDGLSEGLGDYFAVSYTRSLGLLDPSDPEYNWVFKWDGHNQFWPGRVTNVAGVYPSGFVPHGRGQHWSTSLMRVYDQIGRERTDVAVIEGIAMTSGSTTQPVAAQAVLQAAANLGYTAEEIDVMVREFNAQNYNVTLPVASEASAPDASFTLTAAYPNPFSASRAAALTLQADQAQRVRVVLYDVLGRQVRVLYDGSVAAGRDRRIVVDAGSLPSGAYVVRAEGETASATRSVMLVR